MPVTIPAEQEQVVAQTVGRLTHHLLEDAGGHPRRTSAGRCGPASTIRDAGGHPPKPFVIMQILPGVLELSSQEF
ncbi:hypothetical protein Kisp02_12890 [Kineosporia sp. NBRC 101731]|nr:hypothetical protein Kisp02_12890 [Kineosporia sp. NBRC 101731]